MRGGIMITDRWVMGLIETAGEPFEGDQWVTVWDDDSQLLAEGVPAKCVLDGGKVLVVTYGGCCQYMEACYIGGGVIAADSTGKFPQSLHLRPGKMLRNYQTDFVTWHRDDGYIR